MQEPTHFIISIQAGLTKNSQSPMWRCVTSTGERVNVFQHSDPAKDNTRLLAEAGYLQFMTPLIDRQEITWHNHPIPVVMKQDGQWWSVVGVAPRTEDQQP